LILGIGLWVPIRGWGTKGQRLRDYAPHGHWRTLTFVAALRCDRIAASCVLDGPLNGISFPAWVNQQLLDTITSGDIVIMDNLGSHKSVEIGRGVLSLGVISRESENDGCGLTVAFPQNVVVFPALCQLHRSASHSNCRCC
jgi:hypothetical protein